MWTLPGGDVRRLRGPGDVGCVGFGRRGGRTRPRLADPPVHQLQCLRADRIRVTAQRLDRCGANERGDDLLGDTRWQRRPRRVLERALTGFEAPHRLSTGGAPGDVFVELLSVIASDRLFEVRDERGLQPRTAIGANLRPCGVDAARRRGAASGRQQQCIDIESIRSGRGDEIAAQACERVSGRRGCLARRGHLLAVREHGDPSLHAQGGKGLRFAVANGI